MCPGQPQPAAHEKQRCGAPSVPVLDAVPNAGGSLDARSPWTGKPNPQRCASQLARGDGNPVITTRRNEDA
jgi:hypothetical protein